jgi:hypothetical protein
MVVRPCRLHTVYDMTIIRLYGTECGWFHPRPQYPQPVRCRDEKRPYKFQSRVTISNQDFTRMERIRQNTMYSLETAHSGEIRGRFRSDRHKWS